jgi:hypothetical protein
MVSCFIAYSECMLPGKMFCKGTLSITRTSQFLKWETAHIHTVWNMRKYVLEELEVNTMMNYNLLVVKSLSIENE